MQLLQPLPGVMLDETGCDFDMVRACGDGINKYASRRYVGVSVRGIVGVCVCVCVGGGE